MGKVTIRSLPAWGPTTMRALRGQELFDDVQCLELRRCSLEGW